MRVRIKTAQEISKECGKDWSKGLGVEFLETFNNSATSIFEAEYRDDKKIIGIKGFGFDPRWVEILEEKPTIQATEEEMKKFKTIHEILDVCDEDNYSGEEKELFPPVEKFTGIDGAWDNDKTGIPEFTKPPFTSISDAREMNAETTPFHLRGLPESEYAFLDGTLMSNYEYMKSILLNSIRTSQSTSPFLSGNKSLKQDNAITETSIILSTKKGTVGYRRAGVDISTGNIIKSACMYLKQNENSVIQVSNVKLNIDNNTRIYDTVDTVMDGLFSVTGEVIIEEYTTLEEHELIIVLHFEESKKIKIKIPRILLQKVEEDENESCHCVFQALLSKDGLQTMNVVTEPEVKPRSAPISDDGKDLLQVSKTEFSDTHYDFYYYLTEQDIKAGRIKADPYWVGKQWKIGSKDETGILPHCLKTICRFGAKNPIEREIRALEAQVQRLKELHNIK